MKPANFPSLRGEKYDAAHAELIPMGNDTYIFDTPVFRSLMSRRLKKKN